MPAAFKVQTSVAEGMTVLFFGLPWPERERKRERESARERARGNQRVGWDL